MLSSTYYHFREFTSKAALVNVLRYFGDHPNDLNSFRAESYIEGILKLLTIYLDDEVAEACAVLFGRIEDLKIYPDRSGPLSEIFRLLEAADQEGLVARKVFERRLAAKNRPIESLYFIEQEIAGLTTVNVARWLIEKDAKDIIANVARYVRGPVRDVLRSHSNGIIDAQDANSAAYWAERDREQRDKESALKELTNRLLSRTTLNDALGDLVQLGKDHWPDLPESYRNWFSSELSKRIPDLDLPHSVVHEGNTLSQPRVLPLFLQLINRYELNVECEELLVYAAIGWDDGSLVNHFRRNGLSENPKSVLEQLIAAPPSQSALDSLIRFLTMLDVWSDSLEASLRAVVEEQADRGHLQISAFELLVKHGAADDWIEQVNKNSASDELKSRAFDVLIERQHRATIERSLSQLLADDNALAGGEVPMPATSGLNWISRIRSDFAWDKLARLRRKALQLDLPITVGLLTNALANVDKLKTAELMRQQLQFAPESWHPAQLSQATQLQIDSRIQSARQSPFDVVLKKLSGATSLRRLKLMCEGETDIPVFRALLAQCTGATEVLIDSAGGWPGLRFKNPEIILSGCKAAIVVMDGDDGRHLGKSMRPLTKLALQEKKRLNASGIELRVLERYGIENYLPQRAMEAVVKRDLSAFFPIPDHTPATEHLSLDAKGIGFHFRKWVARLCNLPQPRVRQPLYSKSMNTRVADHIRLDEDLSGSDLHTIVVHIASAAQALNREN